MSNRVLLTPEFLKIARPGHDVVNGGNPALQFSTEWRHLKVHAKGMVAVASTSVNLQKQTIWFGKTFSSPPLVSIGLYEDGNTSPGNSYTALATMGGYYMRYANVGYVWIYQIFNDRIEVDTNMGHYFRYIIWDFAL